MSKAYKPAGRTLTYEQAAELSGKHVATIYRWVKGKHVRWMEGRNSEGERFEGVAENDILAMRDKKWPRRARPHAA